MKEITSEEYSGKNSQAIFKSMVIICALKRRKLQLFWCMGGLFNVHISAEGENICVCKNPSETEGSRDVARLHDYLGRIREGIVARAGGDVAEEEIGEIIPKIVGSEPQNGC